MNDIKHPKSSISWILFDNYYSIKTFFMQNNIKIYFFPAKYLFISLIFIYSSKCNYLPLKILFLTAHLLLLILRFSTAHLIIPTAQIIIFRLIQAHLLYWSGIFILNHRNLVLKIQIMSCDACITSSLESLLLFS